MIGMKAVFVLVAFRSNLSNKVFVFYSHLVQSILCDVIRVLTFPSSTYYM